MIDEKDLIPTAKAAEILGISESWLSRLLNRGDLTVEPVMRMSSRGPNLYSRRAVEKAAAQRKPLARGRPPIWRKHDFTRRKG